MLFIDIDGTLTDSPEYGGKPLIDRIKKIKYLISQGHEIVIWSGNGTAYAKKFAQDNDIVGTVCCIAKPTLLVDDNPTIRPLGRIKVVDPTTFFESIQETRMRHARADYNRIQDPLNLIGEDEPVFLLRAKDVSAPFVVRFWAAAQAGIPEGNSNTTILAR